MSQKVKSSLYLAAFVIVSLIYYNEIQNDEAIEMASADVEQITAIDVD